MAPWAKALIPEARIMAAIVWYFFKVKSDFLAALLNPRGIMECLAIVFLGCAVSVFRLSGQPPRQAGRKRPYAGLLNESSYDSPPPSIAHLSDISARHQLLATRYCRFPLSRRSCTSPITRNVENYCLTSHKQMGRTERSPRRGPLPSEASGVNALFCEIGAASPRKGDRHHGKAES